ncbi:DUF4352 domain-containing protein, partial [Nonomuraea sp. NN258]|uniref:DUF4352 domain-containing protein n=1 Tax=Nonomuraea antri TaxID=2730852 RepID=UPI0015689E2E
ILQSADPATRLAATVTRVVAPATPANALIGPQPGNRFVAVEVTLVNQGQSVYTGLPGLGAVLVDAAGQQYQPTPAEVSEGQGFGAGATVNVGESRPGMLVFELPQTATPAAFQLAADPAAQKSQWTLS